MKINIVFIIGCLLLSVATLQCVESSWIQQGFDSSHSRSIPFNTNHGQYVFNYTKDTKPNNEYVIFDPARGKAVSFVFFGWFNQGIVSEYDLATGATRKISIDCPSVLATFYSQQMLIDEKGFLYVIGTFMIGEASIIMKIDLNLNTPQQVEYILVENKSGAPEDAVLSEQHGLLIVSFEKALSAYNTSTLKLEWINRYSHNEVQYALTLVKRGEQPGNANEILYGLSISDALYVLSISNGKSLKKIPVSAVTISVVKGAPNWLVFENMVHGAHAGLLNVETGYVSNMVTFLNYTSKSDEVGAFCNSAFGKAVQNNDGLELQITSQCGIVNNDKGLAYKVALYGYSLKVGRDGKALSNVKQTWEAASDGFFFGAIGKDYSNVFYKVSESELRIINIANGSLVKSAKQPVSTDQTMFYNVVSGSNNFIYSFSKEVYQAINMN